MNVKQKIDKDKRIFMIMVLIGLVALLVGFVLHIEKDIMIGISCGFIPTGIGGWLIYSRAPKSQQMIRNIESEIDERNQFISYRAGYTSFWVVYWYLALVTTFSKFLAVPLSTVGIFSLIFMGVVFFFFRFIYSHQY